MATSTAAPEAAGVLVRASRSAAVVLRTAAQTGTRQPGLFVPARLLLTALVVVASLAWRDAGQAFATAGMTALIATALEPLVIRLHREPEALQLPGYSERGEGVAERLVVPLGLLALVTLVATGLFAAPPALAVGAALAFGAMTVWALARQARAYASRGRRHQALAAALDAFEPEFAVYTARRGGTYQVQMWLPFLESLGRRFVLLTRDPQALPGLAALTSSPVIARSTWRDLDDAIVPSLRAVLYVNSLAANADLVTYRQVTHVYLGHGESDKALSHHPAHAMYDRIFVSGTAAIERYERNGVLIPSSKFVLIGSPQAAGIEVGPRPGNSTSEPVVLYAPTWQGYNERSSYSSLARGAEIVRALLQRSCTVVFRPHPFSITREAERRHVEAIEEVLRQDSRETGRAHVLRPDEPFAASANRADAMVADLSSVVSEFLCSNRPLALIASESTADFRLRHPVAGAAYVVERSLANLDTALDNLLGDDPLAPERARVRRAYVGDPADGVPRDAAFRTAMLDLLRGQVAESHGPIGSR